MKTAGELEFGLRILPALAGAMDEVVAEYPQEDRADLMLICVSALISLALTRCADTGMSEEDFVAMVRETWRTVAEPVVKRMRADGGAS